MKITINIENISDFVTAINHAYIAYDKTVHAPLQFDLTDSLPGVFQDAWINKISFEEMENKVKKDMNILKDFYEQIIKIEKGDDNYE